MLIGILIRISSQINNCTMKVTRKGVLIFLVILLSCFLVIIQMSNNSVSSLDTLISNETVKSQELNLQQSVSGTNSSRSTALNQNDENIFQEKKWSTEDALLIEMAGKVNPKPFNINGHDVLVYLHIQKAGGGTFEHHLVLDLNADPPCNCWPNPRFPKKIRCECFNKQGHQYMFHRHALGWACGVHAGFTELTTCVDRHLNEKEEENRRRIYHYTTTLREPISRFISEWKFVNKGAVWFGNEMICDGRAATLEEVPPCFDQSWRGVSLDDFLSCGSNLAFNRQTRMLANLSLSDCYRRDSKLSQAERDAIMLRSAKHNLATYFDYFGLTEYQFESGVLFQRTFPGLKFNLSKFERQPTLASEEMREIHPEMLDRIRKINRLDIELYKFAEEIYFSRLKDAKIPVK